MDEQANSMACGMAQETVPKRNRGSFRPADPRINRDGRPRHAWAECADRAPRADRFMLLWVPAREFCQRLTGACAPFASNLPADFKIVSFRVDPARDAVAVVIRSDAFARIAKGAPIPEFQPEAGLSADRAPCDDRLKLLVVSLPHLAFRLAHMNGFHVSNLPSDYQIVEIRVDTVRSEASFIIRSESFPWVAKGSPLPEFKPNFYGLKWRR